MSKSLTKDTFRDIKKSLGRFMSILMISALGVAFFVGIKSAPLAMQKTVDQYYDDYNFMDLRLISTLGFTDQDVEAVKGLNDVSGVFPTFTQDVLTKYQDNELVIRLHALPIDNLNSNNPDYINQVKLVEGRLPEKSGEAVVEKSKYLGSIELGSKIQLQSGTDDPLSDTLKTTEYTIVGIVETPYYLSADKGTSNIGSGNISSFMMIPQSDFKSDIYTEMYVSLSNTKALDTFSDQYKDTVSHVVDEIEVLSETQTKHRYDEVMEEAQSELDKNRIEYEGQKAEALAELEDAASQIETAKQDLVNGKAQLASNKAEFESTIQSAEEQIAQGEAQLTQAEDELNRAYNDFLAQKESAQSQIAAAEAQLKSGEEQVAQLDAYKNQLQASLQNPDLTDEQRVAIEAQLAPILQSYESALQTLNAGRAELEKNKQALIDGENQILAGKRTIQASKQELAEQKAKLETEKSNAYAQFKTAEDEIEKGEAELIKAEADYENGKAEAEEQFKEAEEKLQEAQDQINDMTYPEWYVLDRDSHYSYVDYKNAASSIEAISQIFPIFFFLVAALVCLTTMTRMVDEQRLNIGTLKALGYSKVKIASKFLVYAALASMTGAILGTIIGFNVFPNVVIDAYGMMYTLPDTILVFSWPLVIIATLIAVGVTTLSAFFAVNAELKETPSILMRPKAPKEGKRILLERLPFIWNRLNFIAKVTVRNLFRYKKRFFMTVFGIAGCTALLVTGFGVKDSIRTIVDTQFGEIFKYNMTMKLNKDISLSDEKALVTELQNDPRIQGVLSIHSENGKLSDDDVTKDVNVFVPHSVADLDPFVSLRNRVTQEKVELPEYGVVLSEKVGKQLGVKVGDNLTIENADGKKAEAKVAGIVENYLFHYVYLSPTYYEELFNETPTFESILGVANDDTLELEEAVSSDYMNQAGVSGISWNSSIGSNFDNMIQNLNYVVLLMIISAGALAFVVLYNLTNVNISERMREIATIKVLGFYDKEVSAYIYRENIILTLIGTVVGLGLGILLHRYIMLTVELDNMMFGRQIAPLSFIYSAGLTILFAFVVNFAMYYKLKKIEMVESLKSVD